MPAATISRAIPNSEWLSTEEAAAWCGVSVSTLRRAAREVGTPIVRKTRKGRGAPHKYELASLRRWIESWEDA